MHKPGEGKAHGFGHELSRDWRDNAACRDKATSEYNPWDSDDDALTPDPIAEAICGTCPVRRKCLITAITTPEPYGTWGGMTVKQRKKITRARKRSKCPICSATLLASMSETNTQTCLYCGVTWRIRGAKHHNAQSSSQVRHSS